MYLCPAAAAIKVLSLGADVIPAYKVQHPRVHQWTVLHYSPFKAAWDWIILILVMYTAIFTPYVAAFLLGEPDYNHKKTNRYINTDPIVIIDLVGKYNQLTMQLSNRNVFTTHTALHTTQIQYASGNI